MKKTIPISVMRLVLVFVLCQPLLSQSPVVLPHNVSGVESCRIDLCGKWEFNLAPGPEFWRDVTSQSGWKPIQVPGECQMQGYSIQLDVEYAYRKQIFIPKDFRNNRILVRFNGVYSYARVWINGQFIRDHHGGFTSWDCDITDHVQPGEDAVLVVGITDKQDEISYGSGYAHHPIGGILRRVELVALPEVHIQTFRVVTFLDSEYRNAKMRVEAGISQSTQAKVHLSLEDPEGNAVLLSSSTLTFSSSKKTRTIDIPVDAPQKWDAEHPNLHILTADLILAGRTVEIVQQSLGFREIKVEGNRVFVNGNEIKLRGACRHDIHPLLGRSTTPQQDRQDVLLAKEANFNFIRTSHYPPSPEFLDFCDQYGIYVEEETALCFVGTHRKKAYQPGDTQDDPAYTERYLSQLREMVTRDWNHPCVIIWSIGNENEYGANFQRQFDWVKSVDETRPVMFSYPGKVPEEKNYCSDILSMHYVSYKGNMNQHKIPIKDFAHPDLPVLHDEWAHVACYNISTLKRDPNMRNFWGESLRRMWDDCFESEGALGGAIWGMIDEVFFLPEKPCGYGPWGIVDVWRRKKPEFWHTKKAYSPIRVMQTLFAPVQPGEELMVPVYNRFDHTNLAEIRVSWAQKYEDQGWKEAFSDGPDIAPHEKGFLRAPLFMLNGKLIRLRFEAKDDRVIDEYHLTFSHSKPEKVETATIDISQSEFEETEKVLMLKTRDYSLVFDKTTGMISADRASDNRIIRGGPFLHISAPEPKKDTVEDLDWSQAINWKAEKVRFDKSEDGFTIHREGIINRRNVSVVLQIDRRGYLDIRFEMERPPSDCYEIGLVFMLDRRFVELEWDRKALWSVYPEEHIGRPHGTAQIFRGEKNEVVYRQEPLFPWSLDGKDFFLFPASGMPEVALPVTNDFCAMKEHIYSYQLTGATGETGVCVESDGTVAVRSQVQKDGFLNMYICFGWTYGDLDWGNLERKISSESNLRGKARIRFVKK